MQAMPRRGGYGRSWPVAQLRTKTVSEVELPSAPTRPQNEFVAAHITTASVPGTIATRVLSTGTESAVGHAEKVSR